MPNLSLTFLKHSFSPSGKTPAGNTASRELHVPKTRCVEKGEREREADERIRSALEWKNVTVVRPQGEEKLAVARHWPKPRRRSERSPLWRFLFARTCLASARLDVARRGAAWLPPTGLLSSLLSRRFSSLRFLPHTEVVRTPLSFSSPLSERTGPGKLPRTGDLSTGKLLGAPPSLGLEGWSSYRNCALTVSRLCTAWKKKWARMLLIPCFSLFSSYGHWEYRNYWQYNHIDR